MLSHYNLFLLLLLFSSVLSCSKYYTIVSGDICYNIAQNNGLDVNGLLALNLGLDCSNLQIGNQICVSSGGSSVTATCTKTYTVVAGDICWNIASNNGLTVDQLTSYNPGLNCDNLQIGQNLCVAQGSGPTPPTPTGSVTYDQFVNAVTSCGFPSPSTSLYSSFVGRAPGDGGITTVRELAMFLAEILHESGGLIYKREIRCLNDNCPNDYRSPGDDPNLFYFGRGFIQLTWSYNYRSASEALFGDDRLVTNPDLVAQSDDYSWAVSFWYWKSTVHSRVQGGQFGAATNAINGGLECNPCRNACSTRFGYYTKVLQAFGDYESPDPSGC